MIGKFFYCVEQWPPHSRRKRRGLDPDEQLCWTDFLHNPFTVMVSAYIMLDKSVHKSKYANCTTALLSFQSNPIRLLRIRKVSNTDQLPRTVVPRDQIIYILGGMERCQPTTTWFRLFGSIIMLQLSLVNCLQCSSWLNSSLY